MIPSAMLDRFSRIKDSCWYNDGTSADADRIRYGYDRASNRLWRENAVAAAQSRNFDELYSHDGLHRLKDLRRGRLNTGRTALTTNTFAQCWTLDKTGNWKQPRPPTDQGGERPRAVVRTEKDDTGNGTWDLDQSRTSNTVNEITSLDNTAGPPWATPAYDAAGNMTTVPAPPGGGLGWSTLSADQWSALTADQWSDLEAGGDATAACAATYDAWNRLVRLADGSDTVQENAYDARGHRIVRKDYSGGTLSETRHFYDTAEWQVLEERLGTSTTPARQHVWGRRYIDDLILRDRSVGGTLDERLYALQDANWNVTSIASASGVIQERYAYAAYGEPRFLTSGFGALTASARSWDVLYAGYRRDAVSGLYGVRRRYFHPLIGEWLSRDPIAGMRNLYEYVDSQPLGMTDPWGLEAIGHHHFSMSVLGRLFGANRMTKGAYDYGAGFWTGPTNTPHHFGTYGGVSHKAYNIEVEQAFNDYMRHNKIQRMGQIDMENFIDEHLVKAKRVNMDGVNDKIRNFNRAIERDVKRGLEGRSTPSRGMSRREIAKRGRWHARCRYGIASSMKVGALAGIASAIVGEVATAAELASTSRHFKDAVEALREGDLVLAERHLFGQDIGGIGGDQCFVSELSDAGASKAAATFATNWMKLKNQTEMDAFKYIAEEYSMDEGLDLDDPEDEPILW
ncbi:MAG: RHS repeat-associated core domain-containing protein [Planctomyces sp.]|nr:RHS repeat-associated core domain-containing protein [Planctomyces sp.]